METKRGTEMLPENHKCRREPAVWYVLLGAALATCLVVSYFYVTTDQHNKALIHDFSSISNQAQVVPNCISLLNETESDQSAPANSTDQAFEGLLPVLQNASTDDSTIIFTEINDAFANPDSILDLFLESFRSGENIAHLLDHLVIVAMDRVSFERCKSLHVHCYLFDQMDGEDFASEKFYMTKGFVSLVWTKIKLMRHMVELGYNVVFTDLDVLWFRNILKFVSAYYDITLSCDENFGGHEDIENSPNTGLFYVKSTSKNVDLLNYWYEARDRFLGKNEQMVFNEIKNELVDRFQTKMRFVETDHLSGFCNYGKDLNEVYTMQSNCCPGLKNKLNDLRGVLDDWKRYKGLSGDEKMKRNFTWTVPRICLR